MAFPTSPTDGQVYKNKMWRSSSSTWVDNNTGIVESGSNSNGSWIKYSDGTMMQWGKGPAGVPISTNTVTSNPTVTYYHSHSVVVSFPVSFINNNSVVTWSCGQGSYPTPYYAHSISTTGFSYYVSSLMANDSMSAGIHWEAKGRWK